jgi:hypothetical protein
LALAFYADQILHTNMERQLSDQQFSTISLMAAEVNAQLTDRLHVLEKVAGIISPATLGNAAALQSLLDQRLILKGPFNGGVMALGIDGTVIAEVPPSTGRVGINYMDRDYIANTHKEGKATISQPVMGKKPVAPVFGMAVPIRDDQGKVIGALVGVINLGIPNLLDKIAENRYGNSGGYFLVARQ